MDIAEASDLLLTNKILIVSKFLGHIKMASRLVNKSQTLQKYYTKNFNRFLHYRINVYQEFLKEKNYTFMTKELSSLDHIQNNIWKTIC